MRSNMRVTSNPNCDGGRCHSATGEVRVLPISTNGGNLILCEACHTYEIAWRRERNRSLSKDATYDLPTWADLKLYEAT